MRNQRWMMNRAGLVNFWYYQNETFSFSEGKLLLRGTNGSGKSVTMQSFLPVLLDGKKTPDRLDPFGSKARKMEDYLLGEKEIAEQDERTGYLFLEYKNNDTNQYVTTGIGMQAKRNRQMKSWYFVITDNRRIGYDVFLTEKHSGDEVPLSKKQLENRIDQGGFVVSTQKEYMELVNKYVFGFESIDAYEDLIKLLIQLRSPKLSKDFKPTVIYEILESALPPLTDDELRYLSDTIESMDQTQQQMAQLQREREAIVRLEKAYDSYNQYVLAERTEQWKRSVDKKKTAASELLSTTKEIEKTEKEINQLTLQLQTAKEAKGVAEEKKDRLMRSEVWTVEKERTQKETALKDHMEKVDRYEQKYDEKQRQYYQRVEEKKDTEDQLYHQERTAVELMEQLEQAAEEASFIGHDMNVQDFRRQGEKDDNFTVWQKEARDHLHRLQQLEKLTERLQNLQIQHDQLERTASEKRQLVDQLQQEKEHYDQWFTEVQEALEEDIFKWMQEHPKLVYSDIHRQELARLIQGLYENHRFDEVRQILINGIHEYEATIKTQLALNRQSQEVKDNEVTELSAVINQLKSQKMIEPARAEGTTQFRESLLESDQTAVPFYAVVEFQDHVTEEQKERLESALSKVGLLDSLVAPQVFTPKEDAVIIPEPAVLGYTLADYLKPDIEEGSVITHQLVDEVLRSISLERNQGGIHLDLEGSYSVGCLVGHAPYEEASKYIGRTSRKRYQLQQINSFEEKLEAVRTELTELKLEQQRLDVELLTCGEWKNSMPSDGKLAELYNEIKEKHLQHKQEQKQLQEIEDQWKRVHYDMTNLKTEIRKESVSLSFAVGVETIREAIEAMGDYVSDLSDYRLSMTNVNNLKKQIERAGTAIEEAEEELDLLKGEQQVEISLISRLQKDLAAIEEQLKLNGMEEVKREISQVQQKLESVERELERLHEVIPSRRAQFTQTRSRLAELENTVQFWNRMSSQWEQLVAAEINRRFTKHSLEEAHDLYDKVRFIVEEQDRSKILERLTKAYHKEQDDLTEYRLFDYQEEQEEPSWMKDVDDRFESYVDRFRQLKSRRMIQLDYQGQKVSPYFVSQAIEQSYIEKSGLLDEQDRELYEDIIVNHVGSILRTRIRRAGEWVKQMDKIMSERDNSSGLIFSIAWKPLTAESEQEMDTSELVGLLQRNSKFLQEDDLHKITKHFQSKIMRAKELIQLRNEGTTLHQVLKEVLDYRKWFTFVLSYKRVNELNKRELTNNAFFKFSGGEKAMAMYIPLFTAAYSRYKEAKDTAPYIISLDEAFAGVDDNNIRDMFEVVEQLGFNFIMNSQALWGDYDTIKKLSIAELLRPKNANFVTVIRYEWDGKQRTMVTSEGAITGESG